MCLLFLRLGFLLGLLPRRLSGRARLQLARDAMKIVGHLRIRLQEEQLEVPRLVLQLHLRAIRENVAHGPVRPEETQYLRPMRALDHIEAHHKRLLLFGAPRSSGRVCAFSARMRGRARGCGLSRLLVKCRSRIALVRR